MKKTIITLSIIVVIFAIIAFSVTFVLINKNKANIQNIDQEQDNISEKVENNIKEKTIDLTALYDENDLIIEEITFNGIQIPQINGLKNKEVENKVNEDIKNRFLGLKEKYPDYEFYSGLRGNFANIVSFYVYLNKETQIDEDNYEYDYKKYGLNYELVNGELIRIEDVFTKDTNVIDVVRTQFYNQLAMYNSYDSYDEEGNKKDAISFEEELYKIVKEFMTSENNFVISADCLTLYNKNKIAVLDFEENADKIVIYDKYKTQQSIFERNDIGRKGIFTCVDTTRYNEVFDDMIVGYLEENFWCDVIETNFGREDSLDRVKNIRKKIKEDINKQIEEYRKIARKNPDKFYVFSNRQEFDPVKYKDPNTEEVSYLDYVEVKNDKLYYSMTKEYYEKEYKKQIANFYRNEYFFLSVSDSMMGQYELFNENNQMDVIEYTYIKDTNIYDNNTKEKFTKLSDIFIDEYMPEYIDIIANEAVRQGKYREYDIDYDKAIELLKKAEYNFNKYNIEVNIEGYEDLYLSVSYEDFPEYIFKENTKKLQHVTY